MECFKFFFFNQGPILFLKFPSIILITWWTTSLNCWRPESLWKFLVLVLQFILYLLNSLWLRVRRQRWKNIYVRYRTNQVLVIGTKTLLVKIGHLLFYCHRRVFMFLKTIWAILMLISLHWKILPIMECS